MNNLFKMATSIISIYLFLCTIRIIFTWIPNLSYSKFGQFLASVCDPYLNLFRKLPLRIGGLDFSPMIAFGVLMILSSITVNLSVGRVISLGFLLSSILSMIWGIVHSLTNFFILFLIIRLVVLLMKKDTYSSVWSQLDYSINPIVFKIASIFAMGKSMSYKTALIVSMIAIIFINFIAEYLVKILCALLYSLPI